MNDDGSCTFPFTLFPDEIILEILTRLTPKSICRLKCLSKHWLSFLSSHGFLSAYSSLCPPQSWALVDWHVRYSPGPSPNLSFSLSQPPNVSYITLSGLPAQLTRPGPPTLMASSNGLLLFSVANSNLLSICNPVTCHWAPLPVPDPDCGKITILPNVALSAKYTPNCQRSRHRAPDITQRSNHPADVQVHHRTSATSAKENGNICFKNKNFKEALVYYSRSISCRPTAAAYANRAAANFELGKYLEAEMDCSEALKIDEHYAKVYVRRAIVRRELGMFFKAKEDAEMALKLDGQHHEVLKLYAEINCLLEKPYRNDLQE